MSDKKFLTAIVFGFGIILTVIWYEFIYTPAQAEILNMKLEARRLREVEREILELKARHENLAAFVEEKELQLDEARIFLPSTLAQDRFIDELYRTAESLEVKITSIRADETASTEKFQTQVVNVNLQTNYIALLNFIREILEGGRLTVLERISIEKSSLKMLDCHLSFKIFAAAN